MRKYFIETFGCQMNKYDSELIAGILNKNGYQPAATIKESDIVLINTCSVRDHAEARVKSKLDSYNALKLKNNKLIIGVLGCMAQRLGPQLIEKKPIVNFIVGPDNYRKIPDLLARIENNDSNSAVESTLNDMETYSEIYPSRFGKINAWIAIMRGCNNFCSYCIVPYVRGRERSRTAQSILDETQKLVTEGFIEVTLLGQNVNSYHDGNTDFADLIYQVSQVPGIKRMRFATSHPKDLSPKLIDVIASTEQICNHVHLPVQSGSNKILKLMNRKYTREHYLSLIEKIKTQIKEVGLYTDVIVGFPGELEADFADTLDLIQLVQFDGIFSFKYSPREGTAAFRFEDSVSEQEKQGRLETLIQLQKEITLKRNKQLIDTIQPVIVEGADKKGKPNQIMGRTEANKIVVFPMNGVSRIGSLVDIKIINAEGHTLFGEIFDFQNHTKPL